MKIVKRSWMSSPLTTTNLWAIPTMFYGIQKSVGVVRSDREWMWWGLISTMFLIWFLFNFKIIKNK